MNGQKLAKDAISAIFIVAIILLTSFSMTVSLQGSGDTSASSFHSYIPSSTYPATSRNFQVPPPYGTEPAPMGIADYGLGLNGVPYSYNTSSFQGVIKIDSLGTFNNSTQVLHNMTFQMNLNLIFSYRGTAYDFWVQDVAYLDTANNSVTFLDNIWNLSSANAPLFNSSVAGNGTVTSYGSLGFYYSIATNSSPGNNVSLRYPSTVYLRMNATLNSRGSPEVYFLFNDGKGWTVFDTAVFHFASGLKSAPVFLVNGFAYNPARSYYDAELVMGGPGNASNTRDVNSSLLLVLQYFNGHNYQSIQNAYNFGKDTGEGIYNVNASGVYNSTTGEVSSEVLNGSFPLGLIYYSAQLASLSVATSITDGALLIDGVKVADFTNRLVNVSLYPGNYSVRLLNYANGQNTNLGNVTLKAGQIKSISEGVYSVEFNETRLPPGSVWFVNVSGISSGPITDKNYTTDLPNGTYNYTVYTSDKNYYPENKSGSINVSGKPQKIDIAFLPILYNITFQESGLPAGSSWYVTLNGRGTLSSTNSTITFEVTNQTYGYLIPRTGGYAPANSTGSVTVSGGDVVVNVSFSELNGYLTGYIQPTYASIIVNGTHYKTSNGHYNISLKPGKYIVNITASGYVTYSTSVTITPLNASHIQTTSLAIRSATATVIEIVIFLLLFLGGIWGMLRSRRRR